MDSRRFLGFKDMNAETGVPVETFRYLKYKGDFPPYIRVGKRVLVARDDWDAWLAARKVDTARNPGTAA
ncbi:MAG TPA: hypothetical protein VGK17_09210 [Propionicimonas sp.]